MLDARPMTTQSKLIALARSGRKLQRLSTAGLEGTYVKVGQRGIRLQLERGNFQWNGNPWRGLYTAKRPDDFTCMLRVKWTLFDCSQEEEYRITRRKGTYIFEELPSGSTTKFKRPDGKLFLADSLPLLRRQKARGRSAGVGHREAEQGWKQVQDSNAERTFPENRWSEQPAIPSPPSSRQRTTIRVTHSNSLGPVATDVLSPAWKP